MLLNLNEIKNKDQWLKNGFIMPEYDVEALRKKTFAKPTWLHLGAGNIFRAFPAAVLQRLINAGEWNSGLIVAECFDGDIIDRAYRPYDNLSVLCTLKSDGTVDKTVVASVTEALRCDGARPADDARLIQVIASPSLQMVSLTITEKGYAVTDARGVALPWVEKDIVASPDKAETTMGKLCAGLYARFKAGKKAIALVSMDNCSHNGDKLRSAVMYIAEGWREGGFVTKDFITYIEQKVGFPISMIDKITPRPDQKVADMLALSGFDCAGIVVTAKGTYTGAYVNAEETEYLVIEDLFPNSRPPLEKAGIYITDPETVDKAEKMKVCTCLNPLHTSMAVLGCMLGYTSICKEMEDKDINKLVHALAFTEAMPVVHDPGILSPKEFATQVLEKRLPNPFMPDTPQRIACDTSQKLPIRFGETLKAYAASDTLEIRDLKIIPFVLAAWLRYLTGIDDEGRAFDKSPDPMSEELAARFGSLRFGYKATEEELSDFLCRADIFGTDLVAIHVAPKVVDYFNRMMSGKGMVRQTLSEVVSQF